ncbi:unnamed protein product [Ixodes persulcatus]
MATPTSGRRRGATKLYSSEDHQLDQIAKEQLEVLPSSVLRATGILVKWCVPCLWMRCADYWE